MPREIEEVAARSDGKQLHLTTKTGRETTYDWDGPAGAHSATVDEQRNNYAYGSELIVEISVYDAEGKCIGGLSHTEWS